jgi:putative ABC transport system permease protein
MIKDYFSLASNNLKKRGLRSWLTLLGILIGVAAVVSLISLGNGLKDAVNSQFNVGSTQVLTVQAGGLNNLGPPGSGAVNPLLQADTDAIGKLSNVEVAISRNVRGLKVDFNKKAVFTYGISIPDNQRNANYVYQFAEVKTISGKLIGQGDRDSVVLGNNFIDGTKNGFDRDIKVGDIVVINGKNFKVAGLLEKKGSFIYDNAIFMNEVDMKNLLGYGNIVDEIAVKVSDKSLINQTANDIEKLMRQRRNVKIGQEDFEVSTPAALLSSVNSVISGVQVFIIIIASISIFVGAIGISNTMFTSVLERRREIGIMKAIGARNEQIFYQFLIESGLLGLAGGIIGILLGTGVGFLGTLVLNTFLGASTQPQISWLLLLFVALGSFSIGVVSGLVPAIRASKESPVEDIRS